MRTESPLDDLTYDVLTVLQNKAKALEAYDKYIRDADEDDEAREAFEEMKRADQEHIRILKEVLARRLDEDLGFEDEDLEGDDDDDYVDDEEDAEVRNAAPLARPRRGQPMPG
jgi:hypothetical protein